MKDNRRCVLNIDIYLASKNAFIEFFQAQILLRSGASLYVGVGVGVFLGLYQQPWRKAEAGLLR